MQGAPKATGRHETPQTSVGRQATPEQIEEIKELLARTEAPFMEAIRYLSQDKAEKLIVKLRRTCAKYS